MSISPALGGKLLSITGQFPCIAQGWGSGGVIDWCIIIKHPHYEDGVYAPASIAMLIINAYISGTTA